MPDAATRDAWTSVEAEAKRNGWPMLCSPNLEFLTPQLRRLLEVWQAKRGTAAMPSRASLSLRDLSFAAANIGIVAVVREPGRVRFKAQLMGSELEHHNAPITGRFIDEAVPQAIASKWTAVWTAAIEDRKPLRAVGVLEFHDRRWFVWESLQAPLAADGETPDALLVATYYHLRGGPEASPGAISARLTVELGDRAARRRVIA